MSMFLFILVNLVIVFIAVCNATNILYTALTANCLFSTVQLITSPTRILTFFYQSTFARFLEVFVPVIILFKSYRNTLFIFVFTCSRAFQ